MNYFQKLRCAHTAILVLLACCFSFRECYTAEHELVDLKQRIATPKSLKEVLLAYTPLPQQLTTLIACYMQLSKERFEQLYDMLSHGSRPNTHPHDPYYIPMNYKELTALNPDDLILPCDDKTGLALLCHRYYDNPSCDSTDIRKAILQKIEEVVQNFPDEISDLKPTLVLDALRCNASDQIINLLIQHRTSTEQLFCDETPVALAQANKRSPELIEVLSQACKISSRITIKSALCHHTPLPSQSIELITRYLPLEDTDTMRADFCTIMGRHPLDLDPSTYTYPLNKMGTTGLDMLWNDYLGCTGSKKIPAIITTLIQLYPQRISQLNKKSGGLSLCHRAIYHATCLDYATRWGDERAKHIIQHDLLDVLRNNKLIDWSIPDIHGHTCLMLLVSQPNLALKPNDIKDKSLLKFLAEKGGINNGNNSGYKALGLALLHNVHLEVIQYLVELKADPHLSNGNTDPKTALELAVKLNKSRALIECLQNAVKST